MQDNTNQREEYPFTIPDEIKEPVIEDFPPIHIESMERDLSIRDLVDIIKLDGTYDAVKQALVEKEINQAEVNRILYWVNERDQERSDRMFKEILDDIKSRPAYSKEWEELRESVAQDIKECNDERRFCEKQIEVMDQAVKNSKPELIPKIEEKLQQQRKDKNRELDVLTKRLSVLTLVQTESTSREAQEKAHEDIKNRLPLIQSIRESWQHRSEYLRNMNEIIANVKSIERPDKFEQQMNKELLKLAKSQVKDYNKTRERIKKKEDQLIELAQKQVDRTWKSKHLQKLSYFTRGKELDPSMIHEVKDLETAEKILDHTGYSHRRQDSINKLRDTIAELKEQALWQEKEAEESINCIAEVLRDRRERLDAEYTRSFELEYEREHGDMERFDPQVRFQQHRLGRSFEQAQEMTAIEKDLLKGSRFQKDLDMEGFMKDHGFEDIIERDR